MFQFIEVLVICALALISIGVAINYRLWRQPWFPLAAFCLIVLIETAYDWDFIRHYDNEISTAKYEWKNSTDDTAAALKELTARIVVETIEFLRAMAVVWVFLVSLYVVLKTWPKATNDQRVTLVMVFILAIVLYGVFWEQIIPSIPNPWTNQTLFSRLNGAVRVHSGRPDFGEDIWIPVVKATHFALIFAAFATGLIMTKPGKDALALKSQVKYLTHLLFSCAALCVIHVIGMGCWHIREAALLAKPDEALLALKMCAAMSAGNAVSYICILVAFHLPAAEVLASQSQQLVPKQYQDKESKRITWLKKQGLVATTAQFYVQIFAMLSPLIAGFPLTKLLAFVFTA